MYSQNSNSKDVVNFIRRRKADLKSVFHSRCCLCGFSEVQRALEFHHVNPEEKSFSISNSKNQTLALEKQLKEMKKCVLICANCHRGVHDNIYKIPTNWQDFYDDKIAQQLLKKLQQVKTHKIYYCKNCGKEISKNSTYCIDCKNIQQRTCERPSRKELKYMVRTLPFTQIAKQFGVTDNAIRKWCDVEKIPRKKAIINQFSDEEWEKI